MTPHRDAVCSECRWPPDIVGSCRHRHTRVRSEAQRNETPAQRTGRHARHVPVVEHAGSRIVCRTSRALEGLSSTYVVSAFRRTMTVRLKPDTTYDETSHLPRSLSTASCLVALFGVWRKNHFECGERGRHLALELQEQLTLSHIGGAGVLERFDQGFHSRQAGRKDFAVS